MDPELGIRDRREPAVYGAAAQLLGTEARVYYAFMAVVPGGGGLGLPWVRPPTKPAHAGAGPREWGFAVRAQHADNMYTHLPGGALNIFIALETLPPVSYIHLTSHKHTNV